MNGNEKTELDHWESAWAARPRMRFPSGLDIGTMNVLRLLRRYLRPGVRFVEVGCAPGKILSWVSREVGAPVCGIDYSPTGTETARWLCSGLGVAADIRCEDAMRSTFPAESFDVVFSNGLIEHFEDPADMVDAHLRLLAPGGTAVIAIPNYSGLYRALQQRCDPANLAIHNLRIMSEGALAAVVRPRPGLSVRTFRHGRFSPWLISLQRRLGLPGKLLSWGLNFLAHLQPVEYARLGPLIVLEVRRDAKTPATGGA